MITVSDANKLVEAFRQSSTKDRIASLESEVVNNGRGNINYEKLNSRSEISLELLESALVIKHSARQIDEIIHAIGILLLLPHILTNDEQVKALSLAAGNRGRPFDLETDKRIAEFKFINWKGGPESIRQNSIFKDFYYLAEAETEKDRYLYVIGTYHTLKFFRGERALHSVMSKDRKLEENFLRQYGRQFTTVNQYYRYRSNQVRIEDISKYLPSFVNLFEETNTDEIID